MSSKNVIAVMGATGVQGGSVARFLLNDGAFTVRAITRNPDSPAAKELAMRGAEVVKADSGELESLQNAFEGTYGVFAVTNFWEKGVGSIGEITQGKLLVDAAKAAGVRHFVWSTLDTAICKADHWKSKAAVNEYLKEAGVPRTSLYAAVYFENFAGLLAPRKRDDGTYDFPLPLSMPNPIGLYSAAETGAYVLAAFLHPDIWLNQDMRIASEFLTVRELARTISEVSGKTLHMEEVDKKAFDALKEKHLPGRFNINLLALHSPIESSSRDMALARKINPGVKTFSQWVEENRQKIFPN